MIAALSHRGALVGAAFAGYAGVSAAYVLLEVPGLGIGHFFYLPIAFLALASGPFVGAAGGLLATALYAITVVLNPEVPSTDVVTFSTAIRCLTYVSSGVLIGSFASSNRSLVQRLSDLAERDFLTGLLNARALEEQLQRRCAAQGRFVLLLGDFDGLKEVNDRLGHSEGNALLRRVARIIEHEVGEQGVVARIGGDEFAVLTELGTAEEASAFCRQLEEELRRQRVGMSFGWAVHPTDGSRAIGLYRRADERLYTSKQERRSREAIRALLPIKTA